MHHWERTKTSKKERRLSKQKKKIGIKKIGDKEEKNGEQGEQKKNK